MMRGRWRRRRRVALRRNPRGMEMELVSGRRYVGEGYFWVRVRVRAVWFRLRRRLGLGMTGVFARQKTGPKNWDYRRTTGGEEAEYMTWPSRYDIMVAKIEMVGGVVCNGGVGLLGL